MLNREFLIIILALKGYRADHEPGDVPVDESSSNEEYVSEGRVGNHEKSARFHD